MFNRISMAFSSRPNKVFSVCPSADKSLFILFQRRFFSGNFNDRIQSGKRRVTIFIYFFLNVRRVPILTDITLRYGMCIIALDSRVSGYEYLRKIHVKPFFITFETRRRTWFKTETRSAIIGLHCTIFCLQRRILVQSIYYVHTRALMENLMTSMFDDFSVGNSKRKKPRFVAEHDLEENTQHYIILFKSRLNVCMV